VKIDVKQMQGRVPVTILLLEGNLDGSNYQDVIEHTRSLYEKGMRDLLIDMSGISFVSSAGLVALHQIAMIMTGKAYFETDDGWQALHSLEKDVHGGYQEHIKILNPQPRVARVLESTTIDQFIEVCTDQDAAVAAF
jgi:anti-anti-sigma factor